MMSDRPNVTVFEDRCDVTFQNSEQCKNAKMMLLKGRSKIYKSQYALDRSKTVLRRGN